VKPVGLTGIDEVDGTVEVAKVSGKYGWGDDMGDPFHNFLTILSCMILSMEESGAKVRIKAEAEAKAEAKAKERAKSPQFLLILGESASWQKNEKKQLKRRKSGSGNLKRQ